MPATTDSSTRICEVATRLFARRGFAGTSLQHIADELGVTKPSLLYHYASKDALRDAVLDGVFAHWRETLPKLLEAVNGGEDRFDTLAAELIRFFRSDPDRARLLYREILDRPDFMRVAIAENVKPWIVLVAGYLHEGQETGMIYADVDAEAYLLHAIGMVITSFAGSPAIEATLAEEGGEEGASQERFLRELLRLIRRGLFVSRPTASDTVLADSP